jgi:hypothetical protein
MSFLHEKYFGEWIRETNDKCPEVLSRIKDEYFRARAKHGPMNSSHEGYAVLLEEVDEMWDAIKAHDLEHAKKECLQVAAMALAFFMEVK